MPLVYFDAYINIAAIPDYTCTQVNTTSVYHESTTGEYICYCNGYDYKGLPSLTIFMYENGVQYDMQTS